MSETVRVYINARPIDVDATATAIDAVEAWDSSEAGAIRAGERMLTDSRGIAAPLDTKLQNGAIFRIIRAKQTAADEPDPNPL
ncbi:MAG: hypothetical protein ABR585_08680 [Gemmatimonadaceae bacterium]